jgi:hypothetical protein
MIAAVGDMGCTATDPDDDGGDGTAARCRQRYLSFTPGDTTVRGGGLGGGTTEGGRG